MNKQKFNLLECSDLPTVAMDAMNTVHCEELTLVNQLNALLESSHNTGVIDPKITSAIEHWLAHTQAHFERENTLMQRYAFPAYHCHYSEHQQVLQGLQAVLEQWRKNTDLAALTDYVRNVWPQWFVEHIATMDIVTSAFIKQSMDGN